MVVIIMISRCCLPLFEHYFPILFSIVHYPGLIGMLCMLSKALERLGPTT